MGLKITKNLDSVAGCFYELDMGLLCSYKLTFAVTMIGRSPDNLYYVRVHGKTLRGAYKQQGRNTMDGWSGE